MCATSVQCFSRKPCNVAGWTEQGNGKLLAGERCAMVVGMYRAGEQVDARNLSAVLLATWRGGQSRRAARS